MYPLLLFRKRESQVSLYDIDLTLGTLPDGVTFTRASTGRYIGSNGFLASAAVDEPRFAYDSYTMVKKGLLYEPQSTNLITISDGSSGWTATGTTLDLNQINSITGSMDGNKVTENTLSSQHSVSIANNINYVSGNQYCASVYVKAGTEYILSIQTSTTIFGPPNYSSYNLTTGAVVANVGCTAGIEKLKDGWFRCYWNDVASSSNLRTGIIIAATNNGANLDLSSYTGASRTFYWYGSQNEIRTTPTSYVPTSGATATRAADQLTFTVPVDKTGIKVYFDDDTTQDIASGSGSYTLTNTLNRYYIKGIDFT